MFKVYRYYICMLARVSVTVVLYQCHTDHRYHKEFNTIIFILGDCTDLNVRNCIIYNLINISCYKCISLANRNLTFT